MHDGRSCKASRETRSRSEGTPSAGHLHGLVAAVFRLCASLPSFILFRLPAGVFSGCLSYKPQFGILYPVALVAARQWRAIAGATATIVLLVSASIAAFGMSAWAEFPRQLTSQAVLNFPDDPKANFGYLPSVYGVSRCLYAGPVVAWTAQGATIVGAGVAPSGWSGGRG
jgi:hypothetical protein